MKNKFSEEAKHKPQAVTIRSLETEAIQRERMGKGVDGSLR